MTPTLTGKWVWFVGLWISSVMALGSVAMLIRVVVL
ncbi:DUF2474 family protein [Ruegeria jejuensis]